MKNYIYTKDKLSKYISIFVMCLIILQPMLDVLSYWLTKADNTSITTLLRIAMFGIIVLYSFIVTDNKRFYFIFYGIIALYWLGHMINGFRIGYANPFSDIALFIRVVQMPVLTVSFITFLKKNKKTKENIYKGAAAAFVVTIIVIILSYLTGTPDYMYYGVGVKGWFYSGNAQSVIINVLSCLTILYTYKYKSRVMFVLACFACFGLLFASGTRVTYFSIFIIAFGLLVMLVVNKEKNWVYYTSLVLVMGMCGGFFRISPMLEEKEKMNESFNQSQAQIDQSIKDDPTNKMEYGEDKVIEEKPYTLNQYKKIYEPYMWMFKGAIHEYGFEEFLAKYEYTTEASKLGDNRLYKRTIAKMEWERSDFITKLFGYENDTINLDGHIYIPENDFPCLLYYNGYIGTALYGLFILYFAILILIAFFKNFKNSFTVETGLVGIAILLTLGAAVFSGYVVQRPNVSIYLSMLLALIYSIAVLENGVNPTLGLKKSYRD